MSERELSETAERVDTILSLPWVSYVGPTDREDASHRVETELSALRSDHEIHELENAGATVMAFSAVPDKGARVYVDI